MPKQVRIHIGEYYGSTDPTIIKTLLGSCVAVCLFDPLKRIGAMNHIFLPGRADLKHFDAPARFGINAMELLINKMLKLGSHRRRLLAKAFGGAHVLPGISNENGPGKKITEFVKGFLENESIDLVCCDLGGTQGRHVHFHTHTGYAYVKKIPSTKLETLCAKEQKLLEKGRLEMHKPCPVTFFNTI